MVLGSGDWTCEAPFFREMQERYPENSCTATASQTWRKIYAGADIFLMPSKSEPPDCLK